MTKSTTAKTKTQTTTIADKDITMTKSTRTAEQQAEINRLRAAKAQAAEPVDPKVADHVEAVQPEPVAVDTEALQAQAVDMLNSMLRRSLGLGDFEAPSWQRRLTCWLLSGVLAYGAGVVIGKLFLYMAVGAVMLTGSMLMAMLIQWLALVAAVVVGWKICTGVANWIYSGKADAQIADAKEKVTGWFKSGKDKVAALRAPKSDVAAA